MPLEGFPWSRTRGGKEHVSARRFEQLRACGLGGVEVDHLEHDDAARGALIGMAKELDLVITGSSDYHGKGKPDNHLACDTTDPTQFERLSSMFAVSVRQ